MNLFYLLGLLLFFVGCGSDSAAPKSNPSTSSSSAASSSQAPTLTQSTRNMLVIRINYADITLKSDATLWSEKIFGTGEGTLNHFYAQNSLGQFTFKSVKENEGIPDDGIVTVTLNSNHPDPGNNFSDLHPDFKTALQQADAYVDFAAFDSNANGAISSDELLIVFIVAGAEDAYGPCSFPGVFAHQYCTNSANSATADGVTLTKCSSGGNYAVFGERHCNQDDTCHDATIGIIAHELGHAAFDLPDLYDTTPASAPDSAGIGYFGLMGAGMWGTKEPFGAFEGSSPAHFCAWSKIENGWVRPEVVSKTAALHVTLHESASADYNIYKLPINANEYYLLENRNNNGYDQGLAVIEGVFKGGMALWHINDSVIATGRFFNMVNADKNNKGVALIEANHAVLDSSVSARGDEKNLFYATNRDHFHEGNVSIDAISRRGSIMDATLTNSYEESK